MKKIEKNIVAVLAVMLSVVLIGAGFRGATFAGITSAELRALEEVSGNGEDEAIVDAIYRDILMYGGFGDVIDGWTNRMIAAHALANGARERGASDDDAIVIQLGDIWQNDYKDLQMIAKTISREAPYCPYWHQVAVGAVILNRVEDPRFPDNVYDVLVAPLQYDPSYTYDFTGISERHYQAAIDAMNGNHDVPENVVWQAEFVQGNGVWKSSYVNTGWWRSTTYFCY